MPFVIVLMLALAAPSLEAATASDVPLREYVHTVWTQHDGVPITAAQKILQTKDGYLWLVTRDQGLLTFDGMRFVSVPMPCTGRLGMAATSPDGGLWVTCGERLFHRDSRGQVIEVPPRLLQPQSASDAFLLVDRVGRPWFLGDVIYYFEADGTARHEIPRPTPSSIRAAVQDVTGALWVSDGVHVAHLEGDRVDDVVLPGVLSLSPARDGGVFALTPRRVWRLHAGAPPIGVAEPPPGVTFSDVEGTLAEAPDGGLWIGTRQAGVALLRNGRVEMNADTGDLDRLVVDVLVDREGTVWVAATSGLHRYRKPQVRRMPSASRHLSGAPTMVFVDSHDQVWIGPADGGGVSHPSPDGTSWHTVARHGPLYTAMAEDEAGRTWLSNTEDIGYVDNGRFVPVHDAADRSIAGVWSFKNDSHGRLWALAESVGVYRVTPGPPRLEVESRHAYADFLVSDRFGTWVAVTDDDAVEQHLSGRVTVFSDERGTRAGSTPATIVEDGDSVWIGSPHGLRRWRHDVWTDWTREQGLPGDGVIEEIVADRDGHLWMMTSAGLLMVSHDQLDATPDGVPRPLTFARIGVLDGLVAHPGGMRQSPRVSADRQGRLYFATIDSIVVVDPAAITDTSLAPPIVINSVSVDDRAIDPTTAERFVEPHRMRFDFTSLSLRSPENARFRYRLDEYDRDWIEAGNERHVTYGTLRPGAYKFTVIGAGSEGVWNNAGASFAFQVMPVFWRTWWFRTMAATLGTLAAVVLYSLRVRQLTKRFNLALEARVSERTRIARDLHDTLLQTFQGVLIHFQAATNMLPGRPADAKHRFEQALDRGARAISEGRDAVQALRASSTPSDDLAHAISALGDEVAAEPGDTPPAAVLVNVEGPPRTLRAVLRDDVYRIAGEAVRNAMRHARAHVIEVDLHYDARQLRVRIRDDGIGIDARILANRAGTGHWGLPGMRERAEIIGGTLEVRSRLGSGTEVDLRIPASKAYHVARKARAT